MNGLSIKSVNLFNNYTDTKKKACASNAIQKKSNEDSKALMNTLARLASVGAAQVAFCSANEEETPNEEFEENELSGYNEFGFPNGLKYVAKTSVGEDTCKNTDNTTFNPYRIWNEIEDKEDSEYLF